MDYLIQLFGDIPLSTVIVFIAAVAFLVVIWKKFYSDLINNYRQNQEKDEKLNKICEDLELMQTAQKEMKVSIETLTKQQRDFAERQEEFEKNKRDHDLNKLRDRLLQSYRYYTSRDKNPMQAWSEIEKETYMGLFQDYEKMGGNGFMHSEVQPAMEKLQIISVSDHTALIELEQSRKG